MTPLTESELQGLCTSVLTETFPEVLCHRESHVKTGRKGNYDFLSCEMQGLADTREHEPPPSGGSCSRVSASPSHFTSIKNHNFLFSLFLHAIPCGT